MSRQSPNPFRAAGEICLVAGGVPLGVYIAALPDVPWSPDWLIWVAFATYGVGVPLNG